MENKKKEIPLEKQVEKRLIRKVKELGGRCWKFVSPSNRGVCDRIVIHQSTVYFVELKRDTGKMTPLQVRFEKLIKEQGGNFVCLYGYWGVDKFIEEIGKK